MKKRLLTVLGLTTALLAGNAAFADDGKNPHMSPAGILRCGSTEYLEQMLKADPDMATRREKIENDMQTWIQNNAKNPQAKAIVKIPVVVHVLYKTATENISDTYIQQQIDVLNKDYSKTNADWAAKTPAPFQPLSADCEIQFCLATKDPTGAATTGIIHKATTLSSFGQSGNPVKFTAQGGSDAWDTKKYLNIWVCTLSGGLLGYAQFPGGTATTDGVVVLNSSLPGPPVMASYDLGRSATHEVGHWLNLYHINGDSNCGNDQVSDTPTQDQLHFGVPVHPLHASVCSGSTQGEMFCNFMDYVDDPAMVMFSIGQKTRMQACLAASRNQLGPASATNCASGGGGVNDLLSSDNISIFPNPSNGNFSLTMNIPNITNGDMVIYNAIGEAILSRRVSFNAGDVEVDMGDNPDGMYFIKMKTAEGIITKKVVINR